MTYQEQYNQFLTTLHQDTRPWQPADLIPLDGTKVYIKCGVDYKGDTLYDLGCYEDYTKRWWYDQNGVDNELEGEFSTQFGNMEECTGWKFVEDRE